MRVIPMVAESDDGMVDNITDWALRKFRDVYGDVNITKDHIFYYIYGILHSEGYRAKYQAFLVRGLPNIPMAPNFWAFCKAGMRLAWLHLNYERCDRYDLGEPLNPIPDSPKKLAWGKKDNDGEGPRRIVDHTTILIDGVVVYDNIPTIHHKVNGRSAIGWFVNQYGFKLHKESGISNYPLEGVSGDGVRAIIERMVYVGVETDKVVADLPAEFEMDVADDSGHTLFHYASP